MVRECGRRRAHQVAHIAHIQTIRACAHEQLKEAQARAITEGGKTVSRLRLSEAFRSARDLGCLFHEETIKLE
jgi:hypothetical protein